MPLNTKIAGGPWVRPGWRRVTVSSKRCRACGLRLHVDLARRGLDEHMFCPHLDPAEYDRRLAGPPLQTVSNADNMRLSVDRPTPEGASHE